MQRTATSAHAYANGSKGLISAAEIGRAAHAAGAGWKLRRLGLSIRMGGERGKRRGQVRLAALRAFVGCLIASDQLLELGSTIVANIFKDGHRDFRS